MRKLTEQERNEIRGKLTAILSNNDYSVMGIRGSFDRYEIGQELRTSYQWNSELDRSSYEDEEPIELGGMCATVAKHDDYWEVEENVEEVLKAVEFNFETYGYKYTYLIAGSGIALDCVIDDLNECVIEDAYVVAELI